MADNKINVTVSANTRKNITVSSTQQSTEITASADTGRFWAQVSKNWAVSDVIVENTDYSSKYYANQAKESASNAEEFESAIRDVYNGFLGETTEAIENVQGARDEAIANIETSRVEAIDSINSTKTTILNDIEFVADGEKQEIQDIIDNGKDELKESIGDVKVLTTLEIGDIGFTQMAIDESKGLRRILNGQLIIQDQYVQFTNIIKESVALNPSLACTESEWQTAVTMSTNGVCEKFVIDDEMGTIRLPKYPEYLDLTNNTNDTASKSLTVGVKGTGKALGMTDGKTNFGTRAYASTTAIYGYRSSYNANVGANSSTSGGITDGATIGVVQNTSTSGLTGTVTIPAIAGVTSEKIKGTYFIQVATGAETEDNIINEIELNNPFFLGMSQYFETAPNNISWLKSEGQWNAKAVYPTVYDWALINANNGIEGFKLVTDTYTDYDYVINTADETFRLPLLNGSEDLPSDKYIDLALGASDARYTAPANGYVTMDIGFNTTGRGFAGLYNDTTGARSATPFSYKTSIVHSLEVKRGDQFKVFYNDCSVENVVLYRFIYAQGEV